MPSPKDFVIAKLAVKDRILSQDELQKCYKVQAETNLSLGEVIVQRGLCDKRRLELLDRACDEAMKTGRVMSCGKCGLKYFASQYVPNQAYPCPKCQAMMQPMADLAQSVQGADEKLISTLRLKVADQRAQEARHAAVQVVQKARDSGKLTLRPKARVDAKAVPAESGKPFGDYTLREKLGAGGSAVVFKAVDTRNNAVVALKIIKSLDATKGDVQDYVKRFDREARRVRALHHPNTARVYDNGKYGDNLFVAMQFIEGTSLEQLIAAENSEETKTRFAMEWDRNENLVLLVRDVLLGLQHAHERGVVHGDIKPSNMFMDAAGRCYLTDFAIAREVDKEVEEALAGKSEKDLSYLSPEQCGLRGAPVDARSDIFSMGTVLYEVTTLRRPFTGDSPKRVVEAIRAQHPRDPKLIDRAIPDPLRWICLKALEKNPADRYATAGAFADDLTRYVAGEPVEAAQQSVGRKLAHLMARDARVKLTMVLCGLWLLLSVVGAFVLPGMVLGVRSHTAETQAKQEQEAAATRRAAADPFLRNALAAIAKAGTSKDPEACLAALHDARQNAQEAISADPASTDAYTILGRSFRLEGMYDEALTALARAVFYGPKNGQASLERGRCFLELHRSFPLEPRYARSGDLALRDLRAALANASRPADQGMAQGLVNVVLSNESEALAGFDKAITAQADLSDAFLERGRVRLFRVQIPEAMADLDAALVHYPGNVSAHIGRGQLFLADGRPKEALEAFEAAMKFGPRYPWAKLGACTALLAAGDLDRALLLLNEVIDKSPRMAEAFGDRGTVYVRKGDLQRAIKDYDQALDVYPEYWETLANRGYAHMIAGDNDRARTDFTQFMGKAPNHPFKYQVERWSRSLEGN